MITRLDKIYILIPAFNPDSRLLELIKNLKSLGLYRIVVVDDGSVKSTRTIFKSLKSQNITVLRHLKNRGKGVALKTGFSYLLNFNDFEYVITVDCDGQHKPADVLKLTNLALKSKGACVLGQREFLPGVPLKSRIGNVMTRTASRFALGLNLKDTQTGLRALSRKNLGLLINTKGERFEYEMNMLINLKRAGVDIIELPITTVYTNNNSGTHFKALSDSLRILWVFVRFCASSLICFTVDITLFSVLSHILYSFLPHLHILAGTVGARVVSASLNFIINRRIFDGSKKNIKQLLSYFTLMFCQMLASALTVNGLSYIIPVTPPLIKAIVDFMLFFVSYKIQRDYIFKKQPNLK